jgi:hypothetical protein
VFGFGFSNGEAAEPDVEENQEGHYDAEDFRDVKPPLVNNQSDSGRVMSEEPGVPSIVVESASPVEQDESPNTQLLGSAEDSASKMEDGKGRKDKLAGAHLETRFHEEF